MFDTGLLGHRLWMSRLPWLAGVEVRAEWRHVVQTERVLLSPEVAGQELWAMQATMIALEMIPYSEKRLRNNSFLGSGSCGGEGLPG